MTEQKLKEYFEDKLTVEQLALDLKDSQQKTSFDVTAVYIDSLTEGKFKINKNHIIKLLDDTISEKLLAEDLNTIAFALMTSDYFYWDNETEDEAKISNVIFELDNPEIGYDLTIENLKKWKEYLLTGKYNFDQQELKNKFRNDRKRK
jgi:hypothetical protein